MKVTLHEVAARADVSIATASRALNGLAVSEASRARVRRAADELGYVPNEAARALRSERTNTMGLIFSDLRNMLGVDLLDALSETIEEAGYSLLISTARGDADRYDLLMHRCLERRVDALFCISPPGGGANLDRYATAGVPVMVMFDRGGHFAGVPVVQPAVGEAATALADHLHALGHRVVAAVRRDARVGPLVAITAALKAVDIDVRTFDAPEGMGVADVAAQVAAEPDITAVIAPDPLVRGLLSALAAAGLEAPRDISTVALTEAASQGYYHRHAITSVTIEPQRMGQAAGTTMLAWLAGERPAESIRIQTGTLHVRGSTGPAPARA